MTQEELKSIILNNVNLDESGKAEIERFFSESEGITKENFTERIWAWRKSENGKQALFEIEEELLARKDSLIKKGLTAISRGDYVLYENTYCHGTYAVKNKATGYFGLITESGEEILPCIFDDLNVSLTWFLDLVFKGQKFEGGLRINRELPHIGSYSFWYGNEGGYYIDDPDAKEGSPRWRCLQQLIDLLNANHRCADDQDN